MIHTVFEGAAHLLPTSDDGNAFEEIQMKYAAKSVAATPSSLWRRDVQTQMIVSRSIERRHEYDDDDDGGDTSAQKSRRKDKNKHQKEELRRSWQRDLDAINRRGCALEYAREIEEEDRDLEGIYEGYFAGLAYDILEERFGVHAFIGHMLVADPVRTQNADVQARYRQHFDEDDSAPSLDQRKREEEADLDRMISEEMARDPQPLPDDDVAFCGPPQVTRDGKPVAVLQRDHEAQRRYGATLRAKSQREVPYQFWERTQERRPVKPSKYDKGDDY